MTEDPALSNLTGESPAMAVAKKLGGRGGEGIFLGMGPWGLVAGLFFSGVGYFYLKRGRDQGDAVKIGCGIALLLYPYFVSNTLYIILVGAALAAAPSVIERF